MRAPRFQFLPLAAACVLAACSDGSIRSPDLPPLELTGIGPVVCSYPGGGTSIAVGQTATCQVVGGCSFRAVDADGNVSTVTGLCPELEYGSSDPGIGTVDSGTGVVTGVGPGDTDITASGGGISSPPTTVTVTTVCAQSIAVTPASATLVSGPTTGTSQPFTATVTFDNGTTSDVSNAAGTTWSSSNPSAAAFTANVATAQPAVATQTAVTATATYTGNVCDGDALTGTANLTVRPAELAASGGLCIETIPPAPAFTGCRADTGPCLTPNDPIVLNVGDSRQLQIRARFDNGEECNVTDDSTLATGDVAIATVDDAALLDGVAAGNTTVSAGFGELTAQRPVEVQAVVVDQVLGKNSLVVHAKRPFGNTEQITLSQARAYKFACVGANNLVIDGLGSSSALRVGVKAFALAARCPETALDASGNCTAADTAGSSIAAFESLPLTNQQNGVTNLPPRSTLPGDDPLDDRIVWRSVAGYWDGTACVTQSNDPARVGDSFIDPRELLIDTATGFPVEPPTVQPNGLIHSDALVRLGFSCVTAEFENPDDPANKVSDGMTVLVLPATNDNPWAGSDAGYQLCETIAPLFFGPLLVLPTDELLPQVTDAVNGILVQLDPLTVPVDTVLTTLIGTLGDQVTGDLIDALNGALVDPVVEPVLCQLTSGVNSLLELLTGDPTPPQQCPAEPVDPAP
ncbi:MAG: hypothetical protein WC809_20515 [Sinimarinibacterium sp.]|jgi:hypothetical protein